MKKSIILLCVFLLLAGCGAQAPPDISLADVYAANTTDAILSRYGSFNVETSGEGQTRLYVDAEMYLMEQDGGAYRELVGEDYLFVMDNGEYYGYILADGGAYRENFESMVLSPDTAQETVVDIYADGDSVTLTTHADDEITKHYAQNIMGVEYKEGDCLECVYTVNASDLALTSFTDRLVHADGTHEPSASMVLEYGTDRPDWAQEMIERCLPENDVRTLTVVLDPNTEKEQVYTRTVRKGDYFAIMLPEGYVVYEDEACTLPATERSDPDLHLLRFAKKAE